MLIFLELLKKLLHEVHFSTERVCVTDPQCILQPAQGLAYHRQVACICVQAGIIYGISCAGHRNSEV